MHRSCSRRRDQLLRHLERLWNRRRRGGLGRDPLPASAARAMSWPPRSTSRCRRPTEGFRPSRSKSSSTASLARLRTDYVDLYQCHRFDAQTPIEETMEALTAAVERGTARYIGFSEWTPEQIRAGLDVPGAAKFVSSQPQYNMIWRAPEAEVFELCRQHDISQIVWSPLAQGVLTGKYAPGPTGAPRLSRQRRADGRPDPGLHARRALGGGSAPAADRRSGGPDDGPARPRLDSEAPRGGLGDHRGLASGAGTQQRPGIGRRALRRRARRDRRRPGRQ